MAYEVVIRNGSGDIIGLQRFDDLPGSDITGESLARTNYRVTVMSYLEKGDWLVDYVRYDKALVFRNTPDGVDTRVISILQEVTE